MDELRAKGRGDCEKNKPVMEIGLRGMKLALKILYDCLTIPTPPGNARLRTTQVPAIALMAASVLLG